MKAIVKKRNISKPVTYDIGNNDIIEEVAQILFDYGYYEPDNLDYYHGSDIILITDDNDRINLLYDLKYSDWHFDYVPDEDVINDEQFIVYNGDDYEYFDNEIEALKFWLEKSEIFYDFL